MNVLEKLYALAHDSKITIHETSLSPSKQAVSLCDSKDKYIALNKCLIKDQREEKLF